MKNILATSKKIQGFIVIASIVCLVLITSLNTVNAQSPAVNCHFSVNNNASIDYCLTQLNVVITISGACDAVYFYLPGNSQLTTQTNYTNTLLSNNIHQLVFNGTLPDTILLQITPVTCNILNQNSLNPILNTVSFKCTYLLQGQTTELLASYSGASSTIDGAVNYNVNTPAINMDILLNPSLTGMTAYSSLNGYTGNPTQEYDRYFAIQLPSSNLNNLTFSITQETDATHLGLFRYRPKSNRN